MPAAPPSPPKRMTRSRAKAVEEKKPTKITTPAAKAASTATKRAARNTKTEEKEVEVEEDAQESEPVTARQPKSKPQPTKSTKTQPKGTTKSTSKTASKDEKSQDAVEESKGNAPRTRAGRPRKNATTKEKTSSTAQSEDVSAPTTRTRAKASAETNDLEPTQPEPKPTRVKKKVTFQDELEGDKENIEIEPTTKKGSVKGKAAKDEGRPATRARGGRKPPTRSGPAKRGKSSDEEDVTAKRLRSEPLSPKKETQVAKGNGHSKGESDTPRLLGSPAKRPQTSPIKATPKPETNNDKPDSGPTNEQQTDNLSSSVDELQLPEPQPSSPSKTFGTSITGSPVRGGNSTFKDGMKMSPKKPMMGSQSPEKTENRQQPQDSLSSGSPRKINIDQPRATSAFDTQATAQPGFSLAQSPPKKPFSPMKLGSQAQMPGQTPMSSTKVSLFQSPAKRPPSSVKQAMFGSSTKTPGTKAHDQTVSASGIQKSPNKIALPTPKNLTTSLKAARSPEDGRKPQIMTPGQQETVFKNELFDAPSPFSPEKSLFPKGSEDSIADLENARVVEPMVPSFGKNGLDVSEVPQVNEEQVNEERDGLNGEVCFHQVNQLEKEQTASPAVSVPPSNGPFIIRSPAMDMQSEDGSEDELSMSILQNNATPSTQRRDPFLPAETPVRVLGPSNPGTAKSRISMTALADRFGAWTGASPDKKVLEQRVAQGSVFSPLQLRNGEENMNQDGGDDSIIDQGSKDIEEALTIREDEDVAMEDAQEENPATDLFRQSQGSDVSQEYGDENAAPVDSPVPQPKAKPRPSTCTPARVFPSQHNIMNTTSKVPLKPAAEETDSPLDKPKAKRSRSLSGVLTPRADLELQALRQVYAHNPSTSGASSSESASGLDGENENGISTPNNAWSVAGTPARTPRQDLNPKLLSGAVVYVDVHTGEGANASAIFVDLLNQMGAKCVKQWSWNPRNSVSQEGSDSPSGGDSRVGITHVVFKDGGKRTMEKVREANGVVNCVGVGWVLDCETRNKWVDESDYAIDTSTIPRGGHRRRKSMEPKTLAGSASNSLNGSNSLCRVSSALPAELFVSPSKEFLNLESSIAGTPAAGVEKKDNHPSFEGNDKGRRVTLGVPAASTAAAAAAGGNEESKKQDKGKRRVTFAPASVGEVDAPPTLPAAGSLAAEAGTNDADEFDLRSSVQNTTIDQSEAPATPPPAGPTISTGRFPANDGNNTEGPDSPATPYFLHDPHSLVQRTCPPKQQKRYFSGGEGQSAGGDGGSANKRQLLFPLSGRIEDQEDEEIRRRLVVARRKSEIWKPRVGSPLGRLGGGS